MDVFAYQEEFTEYKENKNYESLEGCSRVIACWAKKMFEKFHIGTYHCTLKKLRLRDL